MDDRLPPPARLLGPAGLLPFFGLAPGAWLGWGWAAPALVAYGATILAFLGAVHWGLALRAPVAERGADWPRLGLGVLPALVGWLALLLPLSAGLLVLAAAIPGTAALEAAGAARGWVPRSYTRLRWLLSAGASVSLVLTAGATVFANN
jgi:hypothetical protein